MINLKRTYLIFLLLIVTQNSFSQEINDKLLDQKIKAIARANQSVYLILDDKAIKMDINKVYEEYYKTIYQDTSIVNPNTILNSNQFEIIPILNISLDSSLYNNFQKDIYLYDLFDRDSTGCLIPNSQMHMIIDQEYIRKHHK